MHKPCRRWLVPITLGALAFCAAGPGTARTCDLDAVPAATLLLPYFEVDVSGSVTPRTIDTVFAVLNTDPAQPRIAHVTLWTDWAIPTAGFNLALGAYDEQSVNMIDVFLHGAPTTPGVPGCLGNLKPGVLYFNLALPVTGSLAEDLATLRKAHTGEVIDTATGARIASSSHPGLAKGYVTIDVVRKCTNLFPSSPRAQGYFRNGGTGIATNQNVLVGDYFLVDNVRGVGAGEPMVHIRADQAFMKGNYTFYGRYVGGSAIDDRQPLGSVYASRFWTAFPDDPNLDPQTELVVWRDTKSPAASPVLATATQPAGFPIPLADFLCCDEDEVCGIYTGSLPLATQRINLGEEADLPYSAGWLRLDLNHSRTSLFRSEAQGHVTTIFGAHVATGSMAASFRASRLASPCTP